MARELRNDGGVRPVSGERTESATPKKRSEAVKQGDVLRSRDLGAAASLIVLALWLTLAGGALVATCAQLLRTGLRLDLRADVAAFGWLALALVLAAVGSGVALGGVGFRWSAIAPKWSRISPAAGMKRIAGSEALIGLGFSTIKVVAVAAVGGGAILAALPVLIGLARAPVGTGAASAGDSLRALIATLALTGLAFAALDVLIQWRRREGRLKMTRQEVRDEHKSNEGSPERKRAQRERQYAIAARGARKAMTEATVVLNNPEHFAVALRYRPDIDAVPVVVARGAEAAAQAIRDLAAEHKVPQIESPMLARAIYFTARVGMPVQSELYLAVATILAFVFDLDRAMAAGRGVPEVEVPPPLRFGPDGRPLI